MRLKGKVALVTGTSPNIGGGLAEGLAAEGASVIAVDFRAEPGYSLPGGRRIARADVAEYMLDQLTLTGDIGHAVAVAY